LERPQVNTVRKNPGQLSLGERTGAGIAINAAWHGAALVQTPENRRVIGLFNMAAVCLIGSLSNRQLDRCSLVAYAFCPVIWACPAVGSNPGSPAMVRHREERW
jgi:hypothetical protein